MAMTKKIFNRKAPDYKILTATGAWGGRTPNGSVTVDFFIEKAVTPEFDTIIIDDTTGTAIPQTGQISEFERIIQVGLLLRSDVAYQIGQWLVQKSLEAGFRVPADDQ